MANYFSPLAKQVTPTTTDAIRRRVVWGFLLHTTGRGIVAKAQKTDKRPIDIALDIYAKSQDGRLHAYKWGGPTYVMDHDGTLYQLCADDIMTYHAGGPSREAYLSGTWVKQVSPKMLEHWKKQWPRHKSPQNLYPSSTANKDYIGCEMIPCGAGFGYPMAPGLLFSKEQHDAAVDLARDIAIRHRFPLGWRRTPRLVGHEDVQPIERHDGFGGWDPGFMRDRPYFDFQYVRDRI